MKIKSACIDRTLCALDFKAADKIPAVGGFVRHPRFLAETAGVSEAEFWEAPRKTAIEAFRRLKADLVIQVILPNPSLSDGGSFEVVPDERFKSPEDVRDYVLSLPSKQEVSANFDFKKYFDEYVTCMKHGQEECGEMLWIPGRFDSAPIFQMERSFGAENYYMALALYPEEMAQFFEQDAERAFLENQAIAAATEKENLAPVVWVGQDTCDLRGTIVAPSILDEIYFPALRRALSPLVEAGLKIIWHSDGNITPIVPRLLEAGVDGFQGLQEKLGVPVDLEKLSKESTIKGRNPIIVGSISSTTVLPFGSPEDVRIEVERCIKIAKSRGGGLLLNSSSSVGPEVPIENLRAMFEHCAEQSKIQ